MWSCRELYLLYVFLYDRWMGLIDYSDRKEGKATISCCECKKSFISDKVTSIFLFHFDWKEESMDIRWTNGLRSIAHAFIFLFLLAVLVSISFLFCRVDCSNRRVLHVERRIGGGKRRSSYLWRRDRRLEELLLISDVLAVCPVMLLSLSCMIKAS